MTVCFLSPPFLDLIKLIVFLSFLVVVYGCFTDIVRFLLIFQRLDSLFVFGILLSFSSVSWGSPKKWFQYAKLFDVLNSLFSFFNPISMFFTFTWFSSSISVPLSFTRVATCFSQISRSELDWEKCSMQRTRHWWKTFLRSWLVFCRMGDTVGQSRPSGDDEGNRLANRIKYRRLCWIDSTWKQTECTIKSWFRTRFLFVS